MRGLAKIVALVLACVTFAWTPQARADSFDDRVKNADTIENDPKYRDYFDMYYKSMGPQMQKAMDACFPTDQKRDVEKFVFVADISSAGQLTSVETKPLTPMISCVVKNSASFSLPHPPFVPSRAGFPIVMEIALHD